MNSRGQAVSFDLAIAVFIFILAFISIASLWESNLEDFSNSRDFQELQNSAFMISETLVKNQGVPSNWEILQFSDVNVIGLAEQDRVLSTQKVARLKNLLSSSYALTKDKMRLQIYDIFIKFDSLDQKTADLNMGVAPPQNVYIATIRRIVDYNGTEAKMDVILYVKP